MAIPANVGINTLIRMNVANATEARRNGRRDWKTLTKGSRRDLLLLSTVLVADSKSNLLNEYLKKSQENKAKNDKERLESYYKRNYRDYFNLLEGELRQKKDLSESDKKILEWIENNK